MLADAEMTLIGKRYQLLNKIGVGGMGAIYRAVDRLTGQTVALKRVTTPASARLPMSDPAGQELRLALAREFQLLASLRHPHIISVLDYGFDEDHRPYFTMDLLENAQTILGAGQNQPLAVQVAYLVQTLQALAYLHRRGVLHRDLKPENVLIVGDQVKVLDFGLSVVARQADDMGSTSGTLAYMSPEALRGDIISEASDLYSVGMIAYELFAGRYPFKMDDVRTLIVDIINTPPDVLLPEIDSRVSIVLGRLLEKNPALRYSDAGDVIAALCDAARQPLPQETVAIRESYLQAARFVGRDSEMALLTHMLKQTVRGHGSTCLIGGESGVGKSRLLDELRSLALVQGALVLREQAVSAGGSPYRLWSAPLQWLSITTELNPLEASVIKPLVPGIAELLGRDVPDAPELEHQAVQERLFAVIEDMFRRQDGPVVVILEDLQWAGSESLGVFMRLAQGIEQTPLMILGSYRDDEKPALPAELPGVPVMKLDRLKEESISELSQAMLGAAGREPALVNLLQKETEGNAFFLVEVIRVLAEEAGRLDRIGQTTLPEQVFAGGVDRVIKRRLDSVPPVFRPLLQTAAVSGRQVDPKILHSIDPGTDLDTWLMVCSWAAVLEAREDRWRFTHEKLRDGVLRELSTGETQRLHRQVAEAIESVYPGAPEQTAALAHHWAMAGDLSKEAHYTALAGEQSLKSGAYQEAATFLKRAVELEVQTGVEDSHLQQATLTRQLAEACYGLGNLAEARQHLEQAAALLGRPVPPSDIARVFSLLGQVVRQIAHLIRRPGPAAYPPDISAVMLETARSYGLLGPMYFFRGEMFPSLHAGLRTLNLAERSGHTPELAHSYANMCFGIGTVKLHSLAHRYRRLALETAHIVNDLATLANVLLVTSVYSLGVGQWDEAEQALTQAIGITERLGDRRLWGECVVILSQVMQYSGQFERSKELTDMLEAAALQSGNDLHRAWGMEGRALYVLRKGRAAEAAEILEEALPFLADDKGASISGYGMLALARLQQGDFESARRAAESGLELIVQSAPANPAAVEGYAGVAQVYLALWSAAREPSSPGYRELERASRQACKALFEHAQVFPMNQPIAWICRGRHEWLSGHSSNALRAWNRSLTIAERLRMPYEEGIAYYELGLHADSQDQTRWVRLKRASNIFNSLGTTYYKARALEALAKHE